MNMAVTDEEERLFNAGELSEDDRDMGVEANASDDSEGKTEMDKNNNAMAAREMTDVTVNKGVDPEEMKFMERFAVFMEKQGFIQKVTEKPQTVSCSVGPQTARTDKGSGTRKKLNMNAVETVGELTNETGSEVTVYKQAVVIDDAEGNNGSQAVSELRVDQQIMVSSDEFNNTSDESGNTDALIKQMNNFDVAGTEMRQPTAHCSYQSEPRAREMGNTLKRHIPTPKE